tara:strand:+ start:86 stop:559 length:474 start_codon:yes stop_codon:yes gene_type:complete
MKQIGAPVDSLTAEAIKSVLAVVEIEASIKEAGGKSVVYTSEDESVRAQIAIKKVCDGALPPKLISFRTTLMFSIALLLSTAVIFFVLSSALNFWVTIGVLSFALSLFIVNLPIERKRAEKESALNLNVSLLSLRSDHLPDHHRINPMLCRVNLRGH